MIHITIVIAVLLVCSKIFICISVSLSRNGVHYHNWCVSSVFINLCLFFERFARTLLITLFEIYFILFNYLIFIKLFFFFEYTAISLEMFVTTLFPDIL